MVNDDTTQLAFLSGVLIKHGIDTQIFESAEAALAGMDPECPPDIIITDLYMAGIDGWKLCRLLRSPEYIAFNQIPILVISATYSGDEAVRITADLGANAFMPLPVSGKKFIEQVMTLINNERPRDQLRVIIVDDSRSLNDLLKQTFTSHGYQADTVLTAAEAITVFEKNTYDVAVIDYHLPDRKGDALLETFHSRNPDCVSVMITIDPRPELALEWMKKGSAAYLRKPFEPEYLVELCSRARRERTLLRIEHLLDQRTRDLRDSEAWLKEIFTTSIDSIMVFDSDGAILSANPAACRMYGYNEGTMIGLTGRDIVHPDYYHLFEKFRQLAHTRGQFQAESIDIRRDGTPFHIEVRGSVFQYKGKPHLLSVTRNITDRKRAEHALRASEVKWYRTFHRLPIPVALSRLSDGQFLELNHTFKEKFGSDLPDIPAPLPSNPESPHTGWRSILKRFYRDLKIENLEVELPDKNGKNLVGLLYAYPITIDERECVLSAFVDITSLREIERENALLEAQVQQSQKLESVGRLAGGVAHDLNNLLSPILGYGELLLYDFDSNDTRKKSVQQIVQAGMRARDLVRQLLAFSRKQVLEFQPLNLNTVLRRFQKLLRRTIREDIHISIKEATDIPNIRGDVGQLEQVIMNLAVNAQDAMPNGGSLTIETMMTGPDNKYLETAGCLEPGEYVVMAFTDTGCGMDAETCRHIFEPFFTTKEKEHGTGLGLATVYGIVKQHGGHIWVESESEKGTTFIICLPVSDGSAPGRQTSKPQNESPHGSETILLVEDNKQVIQLAQAILTRQGYRVLAAENGKQAIALIQDFREPIHLLLTDVIMPEMSGKDLFFRITERYPDMKILYMSGYTDDVIVNHGVLEKDLNFIQKPFSPKTLCMKVRNVLDKD